MWALWSLGQAVCIVSWAPSCVRSFLLILSNTLVYNKGPILLVSYQEETHTWRDYGGRGHEWLRVSCPHPSAAQHCTQSSTRVIIIISPPAITTVQSVMSALCIRLNSLHKCGHVACGTQLDPSTGRGCHHTQSLLLPAVPCPFIHISQSSAFLLRIPFSPCCSPFFLAVDLGKILVLPKWWKLGKVRKISSRGECCWIGAQESRGDFVVVYK